ncbi:MAG: hypothetical protein Q8R02_00110 [Hyphomonadaceae bacterium]|nr:hypothetical protein [Hyphomonadaceae bacterium]
MPRSLWPILLLPIFPFMLLAQAFLLLAFIVIVSTVVVGLLVWNSFANSSYSPVANTLENPSDGTKPTDLIPGRVASDLFPVLMGGGASLFIAFLWWRGLT